MLNIEVLTHSKYQLNSMSKTNLTKSKRINAEYLVQTLQRLRVFNHSAHKGIHNAHSAMSQVSLNRATQRNAFGIG